MKYNYVKKLGVLFLLPPTLYLLPTPSQAIIATTTISISICYNGIIDASEICDDGLFNNGAYGSTTATRHCNSTCSGFGPYCGDGVLQALYSEQCDDGNATNGDLCTNQCVQEAPPVSTTTPPQPAPPPPPPPGGGGGGGGVMDGTIPVRALTRVILEGKAYPNTSINVLKDGQLVGVVASDSSANFSYEASNATPGPTTFGFWAVDGRGIRSITFTTTFQVTQNAVTTVSNVFLPPTIDLSAKKITLGSPIETFGATAPLAKVSLFIDREKTARISATSTGDGLWGASVPTELLADEAFHAVKAIFEQFAVGGAAKSGYSQAVNFYIGSRDANFPKNGDLNGDGKVNLIDFSILLFHWNSSNDIADLNSDGKVGLTDFSIQLFNWTG
jgi:cysteine-rich repeat protein